MELQNKTIIVTGASSGIGAAAAELFAENGANVVLGARRGAELETVAGVIRARQGCVEFLPGDVTDPAYANALVDFAIDRFGRLDGAFNNAGLVGDTIPVEEMSDEAWHMVLETNLSSAFMAARAQIPALRENDGGSLVFTSSFVGYSNAGMPGMAAYAAAKAGLIGLTKSLAADYAPQGIRINAIAPGGTLTPMAGDDPEIHDFIANLHPVKRMAEPMEIAQAALFLLSERASFVTGSPMFVDGGISVRLC